jgi:tetratricopeptide (TPR) repeat protein
MRADSPELGEAGEKQWARLRAQIELAGSFWLGFVFSPSPRSVIVLRERAERLLRMQTQTLLLVQPKSPDELRQVLPYLLENPDPVRAGCTWIEAVREDSPGAAEQPWTQAWDELFLRMNERRDALRAKLKGGLVFAAPPGIKPRVREAAPDLWSVRSLVVDFESRPGGASTMRSPTVISVRLSEELPTPDPELALAEAGRRTVKGAEVSRAQALVQAAEGLLAAGRAIEAHRAALEARDLLRGRGGLAEALTLATLATTEEAALDLAAAADHIEQAIQLAQTLGEELVPFKWFELAGGLAFARTDLAGARALYEEAESSVRKQLARGTQVPGMLRNLAILLDRVGDVRREAGDLAAAAAAYGESLALCRRLRKLRGDTPEALRDLSVSLDRMGYMRRESGDLTIADAAYEESLALKRRLRTLQGDTPETLRDLSLSLNLLGDLRWEIGDLAAAAVAYEESLQLSRRLMELRGEEPQALRDLSIALSRMGRLREDSGDLAAATPAYEESLSLNRRLRELQGDNSKALRDLSVSLDQIGSIRKESGHLAAAAAAYEESLALCRRLRELLGDTPETLRDLVISLERVGDIRQESGDIMAAVAADEELRELSRPPHVSRKRRRSAKRRRNA